MVPISVSIVACCCKHPALLQGRIMDFTDVAAEVPTAQMLCWTLLVWPLSPVMRKAPEKICGKQISWSYRR
jgi:hypothetical protein